MPTLALPTLAFLALAFLALALLTLAACGTGTPSARPPAALAPVAPMPSPDTCGAAGFARLIGQPATALERELILRPVRLIRSIEEPAANRLRIGFRIDPAERITSITCG